MNRTLLAITLVILSLVCAVSGSLYIKNALSPIISKIDEVTDTPLTENAEEVNQLKVLMNSQWNEKKFFINVLVGKDKADEIEVLINNATFFAEKEDTQALLTALAQLRETLRITISSFELNTGAVV